MAHWQDELHNVVAWAKDADTYIAKGLAALNANPDISAFVKHVPLLSSIEGKLLRLVPGVGQALEIADVGITALPAIIAFGAAVHFAPAGCDALVALAADKTRDMPG